MKKIVMTMVALLTMTVAVAQQSDNNKGGRHAVKQMTAEEMTARMVKDLNLTEAQKTQVQALNAEYKDVLGRPGMGRGPRGPRGPRPDGQTGATQQQDNQAKKADNQAKKKDKQAKDADKQQGQRPERPQLSDEQKAQMKAQMEKRKEYDGKLKKILTDEQYKNYQQQQHRRGGGRGHGGPRREK